MEGKTLFVTGGNAGIGLSTAILFAKEGANVAIYSRRRAQNEEACAQIAAVGGNCISFAADVGSDAEMEQAVKETVQRFGGLHYAFNNAGLSQDSGTIPELTSEELDRQISGNFRGTFIGMKYQIPAILKAGGGAICNNASAGGILSVAHQSLYGAAKAAVVSLTKTAAQENARLGVRINVVCPGATNGDMQLRWAAKFPEMAGQVANMIPMGRIGDKLEVAKAVLFLCRDATYTTGQVLSIDGGLATS